MSAAPGFEALRGEAAGEDARTSSWRILAEALAYARPFAGRMAVKLVLVVLSLVPLLVLPWPVKLVVDHVVLGLPVDAPPTPWPFFVEPFVRPLAGASPGEILVAAVVAQLALLLLVGGIGTSLREMDPADAWLSAGEDTATHTENEANAGFSLVGGLFGLLDFHFTLRLTQDLNHHYRSRVFERIQSLPMRAFDDARVGDAVYRVLHDTPSITSACYRLLLTPVAAPVSILLTTTILGLTFGDHPTLVWTGLGFLPVALLAGVPFSRMVRRRAARSREAGATTTSTIEEGVSNVLAVQSLGGGERTRDRFARDSWSTFARYRDSMLAGMGAFVAGLVPGAVLSGFAFLYSIDLVIAGEISPGDFGLLIGLFAQIAVAAVDLGALWIRVQGPAAGLSRVALLLQLPAETDPPGAVELPRRPPANVPPGQAGIVFDNVSFRWPDGTLAIDGVTLHAPRGAVTALVGPAGAGKTTLASLVPAFHDPSSGRVLLDGVDVACATRASLRARVAFVFQEPALFDDDVAANLRLGRRDASDAVLERAAEIAGAAELVRGLPQGWATRLGRAGGKLSVGQKQRLSIARALVRDADVLVLDEPTSALDPETEARLVEALREAGRDRVVIVIAHRLSTVRDADQIVFLDEGRVREVGSHAELMARPGGAYRRYFELQTRGRNDDAGA